MWKVVSIATLVAGCAQQPSKLDSALVAESRDPTTGSGGTSASAASGSAALGAAGMANALEDRLARVERRLDKVIAVLEQNLPPAAPKSTDLYAVPIEPIDPAVGPADAKVTIVEVFEFPCPACANVSAIVEQVRASHAADVRVVGKYVPLRGQTGVMPGLVACAAARQGKYPQVKASLFASIVATDGAGKQTVDDAKTGADIAKQTAIAAGADGKRIDADLVACQPWFERSRQAMRELGVTSVPTLFVNGRVLDGAVDPKMLEDVVAEALQKATEDIASGIPQADYYRRAVLERGAKRAKSRFDD